MYPKVSANLGNLMLSLSDALDLAFYSLAMHQQRTAFIAWELGKLAKLDDKRIGNIFMAGLLHDIGALSIEDKISLHDNEISDVESHCIRGEKLFKSNSWLAASANLVRYHHRAWETWEEPRNTPEIFDSQLLYLADHLERQVDRKTYILHQDEELCSRVQRLAGKEVSPEIVDLFIQLSTREEFWLDLASPRLYSLLLHYGPFQTVEVDIENIMVFARLVGMIVDFKSPFTVTHSSGVAQCAMCLAELAGMSESEAKLMEIAGLLHDLGKLVVPNAILEKPGPLTPAEMALMKQHSYYTFSVLSTVGGLQAIAEWAAYHHERLDGKGYPFRRQAHEINLGARIMAVSDIFTALTEDRPYRKGMKIRQIQEFIQEQASMGILDPRVVELLLDNFEKLHETVRERQTQVLHFYEKEV